MSEPLGPCIECRRPITDDTPVCVVQFALLNAYSIAVSGHPMHCDDEPNAAFLVCAECAEKIWRTVRVLVPPE